MTIRTIQRKTNRKRWLILAVTITTMVALVMSSAVSVYGEEEDEEESAYRITDYDVSINIDEQYNLDIHEDISIEAKSYFCGMNWLLPTRFGDDKGVYFAKLKQFDANKNEYYEHGFYRELGGFLYVIDTEEFEPNLEKGNPYTFRLSYKLEMPADRFKGKDEAKWILVRPFGIANDVECDAEEIDHVAFKVTFPKDIDGNKVTIKTGDGEAIPFKVVNKRTVIGVTDKSTMSGLTMKASLPDHYFTRQEKDRARPIWILDAILLAILLMGVIHRATKGWVKRPAEEERWLPPEGMSPFEVGAFYNKGLEEQHLYSTILQLAVEDYLKIVCYDYSWNGPAKIKLSKTRNYDGEDEVKSRTMSLLFGSDGQTEVELSQLYGKKIFSHLEEAQEDKIEKRLFNQDYEVFRLTAFALCIFGVVAVNIATWIVSGGPFFQWDDESFIIMQLGPPLIQFLSGCGFVVFCREMNKSKWMPILVISISVTVVGLAATAHTEIAQGSLEPAYFAGILLCFCMAILGTFYYMPTSEYMGVIGRIKGFRNVLQKGDYEKMRSYEREYPGHIYRMMPFAFAFDFDDLYEFVKRFGDIPEEPPSWIEAKLPAEEQKLKAQQAMRLLIYLVARIYAALAGMKASEEDEE